MRIYIILVLFVSVWILLIGRVYYFSIKSNAYYEELSSRNSTKTDIIFPPRGIIYDRNGNPLAINKIGFTVKLAPHLSHKKRRKILDEEIGRIAKLFNTSPEKLKAVYLRGDSPYNHDFIKIIDFMSYEQMLPYFTTLNLNERVKVEPSTMREYPDKEIGAHVIGYVARISEGDTAQKELLSSNGFIGKDGLEKFYNDELQGEPGFRTYKVNAFNEAVGSVQTKEPSKNHNLVTAIDIRLQRIASEFFADKSGAVIVMDLNGGGIMAAGSFPEYDVNSFVRGLSSDEWNALLNDLNHPLSNKLIKGLYPPGSVVKPGVALGILSSGQVGEYDTISDEGYVEFGGRRFRDWKKEGHGSVDMRKAIKESCDVYFYKLSTKVGIDPISKALGKLGLGQKTNVDLPGEFVGILPSREWKKKRYKKSWYAGDTLITAIGQGSMLSTPMQIAKYTAYLATGREIVPRFALKMGERTIESGVGKELDGFDSHQMAVIREGMYQVCSTQGGTAYGSLGNLKVKVAGKTGTAQVSTIAQSEVNRMKETELEYYKRSHAWLTTYAPYDNPRYVVTVLVEHGGHGGSEAGPLVAQIYQKLLEFGYLQPDAPIKK